MREQTAPLGDVLVEYAHRYRHLRADHGREPPRTSARRRLEAEMEALAQRFEHALEQWIFDDAEREAWCRYLYEGGTPPPSPRQAPPRLFMGSTDWGTDVEIRPARDRAYDIIDSGSTLRHEEVPWELEPDRIGPLHVNAHDVREVFEAPQEAIEALADFLARPRRTPPQRWFRDLYEDGLIDRQWGLTARGHRLLDRAGSPSPAGRAARHYCVVAVDGARSRVFTLASSTGRAPTPDTLVEVAQTTHPEGRAKDSEVMSDSRPRRRPAGAGSPHGVEDGRDGHRRNADRRFAQEAIEEASRVWRRLPPSAEIIVVANPAMLGQLRPMLARFDRRVTTIPRDLSWRSPSQIHEALASEGLLPPYQRLRPVREHRATMR